MKMNAAEKDLVRALAAVYANDPGSTASDMAAWNAHAENVEQDLPWGTDQERATWLQDVAWRAVLIHCPKREGDGR